MLAENSGHGAMKVTQTNTEVPEMHINPSGLDVIIEIRAKPTLC